MGGDCGSSCGRAAGENRLSTELPPLVQLDGSWTFQAQFKALAACSAVDDLSFKENSVKCVTDRGRTEGALRLKTALQLAFTKCSAKESQKPEKVPSDAKKAPIDVEESHTRHEVQKLMRHLQSLEKAGPGAKRDQQALDVLNELKRLPISVGCLKATKVPAELNKPCWKSSQVSEAVREKAALLVHSWRTLYRCQAPGSLEGVSAAFLPKRAQLLAVELEETIHGQFPRTRSYIETVEALCEVLQKELQFGRRMLTGGASAQEVVKHVVELLTLQKVQQKHKLLAASK